MRFRISAADHRLDRSDRPPRNSRWRQLSASADDNTVVGFYTNDGSGWSSNWLGSRIGPDESARAEFTDDTGSCAQTFRVGWLGTDGGEVLDEPIDIDICEASNVYLDDNEIYYD